MRLPLDKIKVRDGRRPIDQVKVRELVGSMLLVGLINPVTVNEDMTLIAGAHRIEAAKLLGWKEIEASVVNLDELRAELAELDENLKRNELHYIDRGNAIRRRDELLQAYGMRRKDGRYPNTADSAELKTTKDIASELGMSERALQVEKQIATDILPDVQLVIKNTDLPKRDALKIARLEPSQQLRVAHELNEGATSLLDAQRRIKRNDVHSVPELEGMYRVIYADPPWAYGDKLTEGYGPAENHYPTMTLAEICDLPVKDIAEDNAVLFLWATSPMLEDSFEVIRAWGFAYKTTFVWDKVRHNMGHYNSVRHELLLVCTRGSCLPDIKKLYDSVVTEERSEHSKKPETFRAIIDDLYPHGGRVELFARSTAPGWKTWGNQA